MISMIDQPNTPPKRIETPALTAKVVRLILIVHFESLAVSFSLGSAKVLLTVPPASSSTSSSRAKVSIPLQCTGCTQVPAVEIVQ